MTGSLLVVPIALLVDQILGEPRRFHPLIGFGNIVSVVERKFNITSASFVERLRGSVAFALVTIPVVSIAISTQSVVGRYALLLDITILWLAIGSKSLREHGKAVRSALVDGDLPMARKAVGRIVSRDTDSMTETEVINATIESTLENGCDALFAPLFWYAVLGVPGVLFYRLVNTLDAMWGYRTSRYLHFGWAAARFDDFLNYIPARLTALTYSLVGDSRSALACWLSQAALCESPNGGPVMSAGAGALGINLGGTASYHGKTKQKPILGCGRPATIIDIDRTWLILFRSAFLWGITIPTVIYLCGNYA